MSLPREKTKWKESKNIVKFTIQDTENGNYNPSCAQMKIDFSIRQMEKKKTRWEIT